METNDKIRKELVVLEVLNLGGVYNFQQLPQIRDKAKRIIDIEPFSASQVALTYNGKTVISETVLKKSSLRLVELGGSNAEFYNTNLYSLQRNTAQTERKPINCQPIDWEKSVITVPETTGLSVGEAFYFEITYEKK